MNPRQESYSPGEHHFYGLREPGPKDTLSCDPKTGKAKKKSWYSRNKPLALSLGNLLILVPMVFFLYPYLLHQASIQDQKNIGPLGLLVNHELNDEELSLSVDIRWIAETQKEGDTLVLEFRYGEKTHSTSVYIDPEDSPLLTEKVVFEGVREDLPVIIRALWKKEILEWTPQVFTSVSN